MRKFALILLLFVAGANAQQMKHFDSDDVASSETEAPLGLDLMGGSKDGVTVFPNASNDHILISVAGKHAEKKSIVIYNSTGNLVFKTVNKENTYLVDVSGLHRDLYFIEISSGSKVYRKKWYRS